LEEKSLVDILQEMLSSEKTTLPVFSRTAIKVQEEVSRWDMDIRRLEEIIASDQSLTGQVLRVANSAFYRGLKKVTSIREAIIRLGSNEIATMALLLSQKEIFTSKDKSILLFMDKLWLHAVGCAIGTQWLARKLEYHALATEAFISGLLHDIGKLFILTVLETIKQAEGQRFKPTDELIFELMDSLHCEYGHALLSRWNLPEIYCTVTRDHHNEEVDPNATLLNMTRLVDQACNKMGIGLYEPSTQHLVTLPEAELLGLSEVSLAQLEIKLEDALILARTV
jgi:HD-like signal output (HDOD) protein